MCRGTSNKFTVFLFSFFIRFITLTSQIVVPMTSQDGIYLVPCKVNGIALEFIFDSGASDVSISLTEAQFMIKNGQLQKEDIIGKAFYQIANGQITEGTKIIIKSLEIGGQILENVEASIVHNLDAPLLLGQSAISRFGEYHVNYREKIIVLGPMNVAFDYQTNNFENEKIKEIQNLIQLNLFEKAANLAEKHYKTYNLQSMNALIAFAINQQNYFINTKENKKALVYFQKWEDHITRFRELNINENYLKSQLLLKNGDLDFSWSIVEGKILKNNNFFILKSNELIDSYFDFLMKSRANGTAKNIKKHSNYVIYLIEQKQLIEINKTSPLNLFRKARCLHFMDRNHESLAVYQEIVSQDSNFISGYYLIATTTALLDPNDSSGIVTQAYENWVARLSEEQQEKYKKDIENAYRNMAFYAQKNKDFEKTSYYYGKVLELNPDDTIIADVKARIDDYLKKNQPKAIK